MIVGIQPKISVIVPVYNSENYLKKCIQSILVQTYSDFELILINDGSTDASGAICNQFASYDSRIRVHHQGNKGVSTARNCGIELSMGEWITFVDSDDWIEEEYLSNLIRDSVDYDLVLSYYYALGWDGWVNHPWVSGSYTRENIKDSFADNMREYSFVCSKMYKSFIIKKYALRFNPQISYAEDLIFTLSYLQHTNNVKILSEALYCYNCYSTNNSSSRKWSWEAAEYTIDRMCDVLSGLEIGFNWDGSLVKNYYTWAFLRRYLKGIVPKTSVLQLRLVLREVSRNNCISRMFRMKVPHTGIYKTIFNYLMLHQWYLAAALMIYVENRIVRKK